MNALPPAHLLAAASLPALHAVRRQFRCRMPRVCVDSIHGDYQRSAWRPVIGPATRPTGAVTDAFTAATQLSVPVPPEQRAEYSCASSCCADVPDSRRRRRRAAGLGTSSAATSSVAVPFSRRRRRRAARTRSRSGVAAHRLPRRPRPRHRCRIGWVCGRAAAPAVRLPPPPPPRPPLPPPPPGAAGVRLTVCVRRAARRRRRTRWSTAAPTPAATASAIGTCGLTALAAARWRTTRRVPSSGSPARAATSSTRRPTRRSPGARRLQHLPRGRACCAATTTAARRCRESLPRRRRLVGAARRRTRGIVLESVAAAAPPPPSPPPSHPPPPDWCEVPVNRLVPPDEACDACWVEGGGRHAVELLAGPADVLGFVAGAAVVMPAPSRWATPPTTCTSRRRAALRRPRGHRLCARAARADGRWPRRLRRCARGLSSAARRMRSTSRAPRVGGRLDLADDLAATATLEAGASRRP